MTAIADPRIAALHSYDILDTPSDPDFDGLVQLASVIAGTPVAVINLIDATRQWFKAEIGLGVRETPLDTSICAKVMLEPDLVEIPDLSRDRRFECNPLIVEGPQFRFYAGVLLLMQGGHVLGTLCVLGPTPQRLDEGQRTALRVLGRQVVAQIELRRQAALADARARSAVQADLERRAALEQLREADRRKDRFIATLAHELRNPLAPIANAAAVLGRAGLAPERIAWCGDIITRQVRHMGLLLDDLLDVARAAQGKLELRPAQVALGDVVQMAVELARPLVERKEHALVLDLPPGSTLLRVDPTRLAQVLGNLLTNAAKYTAAGGRIVLGAHQGPAGLTVWVQDNGTGLAPDMLERVFELFAQVHESLGQAEGGLGIGLALARRVVELHGGTLVAASDGPGQGSRFTMSLPAHCLAAA